MSGFDPTQFFKGMASAEQRMRGAAVHACVTFAEQVLADSQDECPVSPTDAKHPLYNGHSGALRDSGVVKDPENQGGKIVVEFGYNTDYAAAVHERLDLGHQYPGAVNSKAKAKYLEDPIRAAAPKFGPYLRRRSKRPSVADQIEPKDFIASLADVLAVRSGLNGTDPRQLWGHSIDEGTTPLQIPVSRLTQYGGRPIETAPVNHATVQCYTRHTLSSSAMTQSRRLARALRDSDGLPMQGVPIDGYLITAVFNLTAPGLLSRDAIGRAEVVFNFEVDYLPA